ncbi:MAG: hypothetical protein ACLFPQ_04820 [Candidatus Woesearchaeota archaeon]
MVKIDVIKLNKDYQRRHQVRQVKEKFDKVIDRFKDSEYIEEFKKCVQCGYCRNTSAAYHIHKKESESHPGKMFIIKNFMKKDNKKMILDTVYHMTLAGYAENVCPAGIRHEFAWNELRKDFYSLAKETYPKLKEALENLNDPEKNNIFGKKKSTKFNWMSEIEHRRSDFLYYVGSNDLLNNRDRVRRMLWILNKFSIPYTISKFETDSGYIAKLAGDQDTEEKCAKRLKDLVGDLLFKKIIVSCPFEFRRLRDIFDDEHVEVIHIMEIISNKLKILGSKKVRHIKARCAYLDNFYLSEYYPSSMPREILRNIGCDIVEKSHSKQESFSSGAGDCFELVFPYDAEQIAKIHLKEAQDAKAEYLVTSDSFAQKLLSDTAKKTKSKVKVIDLSALVVKAIKWAV